MIKSGLGILVVVISAVLAAMHAMYSWDGGIFITSSRYFLNERTPAAIQKAFDYSRLDGQPLKIRSLKRLIEDARIQSNAGKVSIELGHFVTKGVEGRGQLACEFYNRVRLTFLGEGIMESGEQPKMVVEAPCEVSSDINRIEAIWIPAQDIMQSNPTPPSDLDLTFPERPGVYFKFTHLTSEWPRDWALAEVQLFSDAVAGREVRVNKAELDQMISNPVRIRF